MKRVSKKGLHSNDVDYRVSGWPYTGFADTVVSCVLENFSRIGWDSVKKFTHTITTIIILLYTFCFRTGIFWLPPIDVSDMYFVHEFLVTPLPFAFRSV